MEALALISSELLPLLQKHSSVGDTEVIGDVDNVHRKRNRDDLPTNSFAHWTRYLPIREFSILQRLVSDIASVLAEPPSDRGLGGGELSEICHFFFGEEFLEMVADAVNVFVIRYFHVQNDSGVHELQMSLIPSYQTTLQLSVTQLCALKSSHRGHSDTSSLSSHSHLRKYDLNFVRWPNTEIS